MRKGLVGKRGWAGERGSSCQGRLVFRNTTCKGRTAGSLNQDESLKAGDLVLIFCSLN